MENAIPRPSGLNALHLPPQGDPRRVRHVQQGLHGQHHLCLRRAAAHEGLVRLLVVLCVLQQHIAVHVAPMVGHQTGLGLPRGAVRRLPDALHPGEVFEALGAGGGGSSRVLQTVEPAGEGSRLRGVPLKVLAVCLAQHFIHRDHLRPKGRGVSPIYHLRQAAEVEVVAAALVRRVGHAEVRPELLVERRQVGGQVH
eukprot:EG_transcript_16950